jgi:CDP-diglyceride synthetase
VLTLNEKTQATKNIIKTLVPSFIAALLFTVSEILFLIAIAKYYQLSAFAKVFHPIFLFSIIAFVIISFMHVQANTDDTFSQKHYKIFETIYYLLFAVVVICSTLILVVAISEWWY